MYFTDDARAKEVWRNHSRHTPVVLRRRGKPVRLRMPYGDMNRLWLHSFGRRKPVWDRVGRFWELPASWFDRLVEGLLVRFGEVYVIQEYREQEKCAPACLNAKGFDCVCSCMGANHGQGDDGSWFTVSDTFAFRQGDLRLSCRLLKYHHTPKTTHGG